MILFLPYKIQNNDEHITNLLIARVIYTNIKLLFLFRQKMIYCELKPRETLLNKQLWHTDMFSYKALKIVFVCIPLFLTIQGCASAPQMAKVEPGKKQPVNNSEWIQNKQARFNEDIVTRTLLTHQLQAQVASHNAPAKEESPSAHPEPQFKEVVEHFAVPFAKSRSPLTSLGQRALDRAIKLVGDGEIRVIGRPDEQSYDHGILAGLPQNRANIMRNYLLSRGVSSKVISVRVDTSPNPPVDNVYVSNVVVTHKQLIAEKRIEIPTVQDEPIVVQTEALQPESNEPKTAFENKAKVLLIKWVLRLVQTKQLSDAAGARIIRDLTGETTAEIQEPQENKVVAAIAAEQPEEQPEEKHSEVTPTLFVAAISTIRKPLWVLDTGITLKENLDVWSKQAGWAAPEWLASNFFQVTSAATLEGEFIDVLGQIAEGTRLNFCVTQRQKRFKVMDSNISCKN